MADKHMDILNVLMKYNEPVSSAELARELKISVRSVKSYIQQINRNYDLKFIIPTKNGYILNKEYARVMLSESNSNIPQNYEERSIYIIKQLLIEHPQGLDLYTLCDMLYISDSTLKSDLIKMNKTFSTFNISFENKNDILYVNGKEKYKRKLISYVLSEEVNGKFTDIKILKDSFPNFDVSKLSKIVKSMFKKYKYYLNDFTYVNLILHLVIIVDRISTGNIITGAEDNFKIENSSENAFIRELCAQIEKEFNVKFNNDEFSEILTLIRTNVNYSISDHASLQKLAGNDVLTVIEDIVQKINENYFIDLPVDSFMIPLTLHIKNLILRMQKKSYVKNPMAETIKNSCPIIYEIAVFFSIQLMNVYKININEDEIGFIAFHIGAQIERKQINKSKIQCIILCPEYYSLKNILYNNLLFDFGNYINVLKIVSFEYELEGLKFDLLISTLKTKANPGYKTILVSPFSLNIDKSLMFDTINQLQQETKYEILKNNFKHYFNPELFFCNLDFSCKEDVIKILSNKMLDLGYVDLNFTNQVLEREHACSTAFYEIAIPHSVKMEAIQTNVAVLISKSGIPWDTHLVHVVLLVALNKLDRKNFRELYEALVILFNKESVIKLIKNCTSFSDFQSIIYTGISNKMD